MSELRMFGTVKPMRGPAAISQENALQSWARVAGSDVLLVGDDDGAEDLAAEVGIGFHGEVLRSPLNVPLLDDLFRIGQAETTAAVSLFSNTDLVFFDDVAQAAEAVAATIDGPFLMVGQRWDVVLDAPLDFDTEHWEARLRDRVAADGSQDAPGWVDWFAFRTGTFLDLPPFVVGRPGYDHWLIAHALQIGLPVVDASDAVMPVHQHHEYRGGQKSLWSNEDSLKNAQIIGPRRNRRTIANATVRLDGDLQLLEAKGLKYRAGAIQAALGPVLEFTAPVRHRFGFDTDRVFASKWLPFSK